MFNETKMNDINLTRPIFSLAAAAARAEASLRTRSHREQIVKMVCRSVRFSIFLINNIR